MRDDETEEEQELLRMLHDCALLFDDHKKMPQSLIDLLLESDRVLV